MGEDLEFFWRDTATHRRLHLARFALELAGPMLPATPFNVCAARSASGRRPSARAARISANASRLAVREPAQEADVRLASPENAAQPVGRVQRRNPVEPLIVAGDAGVAWARLWPGRPDCGSGAGGRIG